MGEDGVLIREATRKDWVAIWPFLHRIVASGETYAYDRDLTEDQARTVWLLEPLGRTVVAVDAEQTMLATAKMHPTTASPARTSPPRASWSIPSTPGEAWDAPSASTPWPGRAPRATVRCSSTRWSRPIPARLPCGDHWASRCWPPSPRPFTTPCSASSGCTSCTVTSELYCHL